MLGHDSLLNFIKTNFSLVQFHKYSLTELENMMPWERASFVDLLQEHLTREGEIQRDLKHQKEALMRRYG